MSSGAEPSQAMTSQKSYTSGISDTPLLGMITGDFFDQTIEAYPDHPTFILRAQQIIDNCNNRSIDACRLMHLGLQKGERIGIWSLNRAAWCIT